MCLNARTIHLSTKHQLFQNNAEHVFNTCITYQLFWNIWFNFKSCPNIYHYFYSIEKFHYLSVNIITGGTFTWKHFCWICWVPCVLILYKCVGLRIFVLYIVKLIIRKGFSLECKISQYKYLEDNNC